MFSTKQSDIFYNDETKEMFVCKVSAISAERCEGSDEVVYGALPLVYKINKADNYKTLVYPKNLNTIQTDPNSDLYNLTPTCPTSGTNFDSITKPLINYNKTTSRYSVTFLGRYSTDTEGLGLNNYIFQDINSDFYLLDANVYIPKDKDVPDVQPFTFANGHLNSNLYVVGNTIRNDKASWFTPSDNPEQERSTDYQVAPMYVQATSSLGFNLLLGNTDVTVDSLSGNVAFPFMYSGGFITYNPKYTAYDPEYTIRVDFTARSFNVPSPTAYASAQTVGNSATRWVQQYDPAGAGEGFCVSFFKNPPKNSYIIPNGIGSTLGYAKAGFSPNEVAGTAQPTDGLWLHNNWNPNTGISARPGANVDSNYGPAESFLGVGFDIGGNFASKTEEKEGWTNDTSYTATPCSIGIRASSYYDTKVLTAFAMNTVAASAVPMHTSAADAEFVDYRIDLSNKGTKVTLYNKLTSATDYNTIVEYRLNRGNCGTGVGIGSSHTFTYQPWYNMQSSYQQATDILPPLNIGLSFTTSNNVSRFELYKFEVTGVVIKNPWEEKIEEQVEEVTASVTKKIDYLQESSKNLRKKLLNVESDDLVDVEMAIPAKNIIANTINEETNKPQITICDGTNPDIIEDDVDIKITGITPEQVDKAIEVGESGYVPKIPGSTTTIKRVGRDLDIDTVVASDGGTEVTEKVRWDSWLRCRIPGIPPVSYIVEDIEAESDGDNAGINHTGRFAWLVMTDRTYSIYVQVLVLDDFVDPSDLNDWFVKHPFKGKGSDGLPPGSRQLREEDSTYAIRANSILKSIIKAFIADTTIDRTQYNWALKWHPADGELTKNSLLKKIGGDADDMKLEEREEIWESSFTGMGFVELPSNWTSGRAAFGQNTLTPKVNGELTVPEFGNEWACAASWDHPDGGGDPVSTGIEEKPPIVEEHKYWIV